MVNNDETPSSDPTAAKPLRNGITEPSRTANAFTTYSENPTLNTARDDLRERPVEGDGGGGWGSDRPASGDFSAPGQPGLSAGGFGSTGGARTISRGVEETVTVTLLPEKEGMFLFQHHNYEVKSARRASSVVRRYSDFVWLLDCLHKRYPFRALPLLPPKSVAGKTQHCSKTQMGTDLSF